MSDTVKVDVLQIDTGKSKQSVAGLRNEIKSLKDQLVGLDEGTKEYNDTLLELGDKMHQLKEINEQVRQTTTDFGDRLSNVRGTITGLTGAFQTVLGSLSLLGVNLGDDVKMLKMLQSAMSITQGVAAIDSGVKAFKALSISIKASTAAMSGLKKALLSSGIGAVVLLVGALASGLLDMGKDSEDATESARKGFEKLKGEISGTDRELQRLLKRMKAEGATEEELYNTQLENLQKKEQALTKQIQQYSSAMHNYAWDTEEHKRYQELIGEIMRERREINEQIADLQNDYYVDGLNAQNAAAKKRLEAQRAAAQKEAEQRKADIAKIAQIESEAKYGTMGSEEGELAKLEANYKDQLALYEKYGQDTATLTEYYEKQKAEIIAKYSAERAEAKRAEAEAARDQAELQAETEYQMRRAELIIANEANVDEQLLQLDMDFRDRREELLRKRYEEGLLTTEEFNNQLAQLEVEAANLQIEQEERVTARTQTELEKRKKMYQSHQKAVQSVTSSVCSILGTIGDTLEQGTSEWKAIMTARSIIETIAGSISAFMTTLEQIGGIPGLIAGAAAAATTMAAGMAEVYKIQTTNVSGSSSASAASSGSTALGNVSQGAVSVLSTQVTNTRSVATEDDIANLPDTRVYVLESDITDSQRRVRTTVENSTY